MQSSVAKFDPGRIWLCPGQRSPAGRQDDAEFPLGTLMLANQNQLIFLGKITGKTKKYP